MTLNLPIELAPSASLTEEERVSSDWSGSDERNVGSSKAPLGNILEAGVAQGAEKGSGSGSSSSAPGDILGLLPPDPFDMGQGAALTTDQGWFKDPDTVSEDSGNGGDEVGEDYEFVTGFNFVLYAGFMFAQEPNERIDGGMEDKETGDASFDTGFVSIWNIEEILSFGEEDGVAISSQSQTQKRDSDSCSAGDVGAPHDAMQFVLYYLDLLDLLSVESVCKTMRDWVRSDYTLWKNIRLDMPLSERLTDDTLISLTRKAHGNLKCLNLVHCPAISDDGLRIVLQSNPTLTTLSVPGCSRISAEGLVSNIRAFNSSTLPGIKCLRIGEFYQLTNEQFEELKSLLGDNNNAGQRLKVPQKTRIYPLRYSSLCDSDFGAIDVELCPRCENPKIVYDCPVQGCRGEPAGPQGCRACTFCIKRCCICGRCISHENEYEETFSLEWVCSSCWKEKTLVAGQMHTIFHQEMLYHFRIYG